jgi:hypothetical protein
MARTRRREGKNECGTQERSIISGSSRVRLSLAAVLSPSASGGASRSRKQLPCDGCGALSLGVSVNGDSLAGCGIQTQRSARSKSDFPDRLLVCCTSNSGHARLVGMVAILKARHASVASEGPITTNHADFRKSPFDSIRRYRV